MRAMYKIETLTKAQMMAARYLAKKKEKRETSSRRLAWALILLATYATVVGVLS